MPEIERTKDPFGAGRGKSFRQQTTQLSTKVKKHLHDKYYIPPYRPTNRNWEMTFASLGFNRKTIEKFWRLFCQINHSTGAIQLDHFLEHFRLDWTPWTERCFAYFDTTGGGDVDFLEFMISVWNVCTYKIDSLPNFAFDMYDLDTDGELSIPEIERMVNELFGAGGGKRCLKQAIEFAEARGGALNLNSFIAFTGSHQMLLFPMFQIQRKLQRKVFGLRFWEKVERRSKENFNDRNVNEFNPRHVQILLRTYQTGGAMAVLSHTGDPNKGLRDWYENQKDQDANVEVAEDEPAGKKTAAQRWNLLKEHVNKGSKKDNATKQWASVRRNILNGEAIKQNTLERIRSFKPTGAQSRRKTDNKAGGDENDDVPNERPTSALPANVANDLKRIRERRKYESSNNNSNSNTPNDRPSSANRPTSALPANVADDLKRIRERRMQSASNDNRFSSSRPSSAELPPNVAADLRRIRERRNRKASKIDPNGTKVAKRRPRQSTAVHTNVRKRQAGNMFFNPDTNAAGSRGWLE